MKIALDAKRAFYNQTGLGNYSRNLIEGFNSILSSNDKLFLFTPKLKNHIYRTNFDEKIEIVKSESLIRPYWRSFSIAKDIKKNNIDIYHGLSNELPFSSTGSNTKTVVTIHDLLFLRFPHLYPVLDRNIYFHKAKKACNISDKIIATSIVTKNDIIEKLNVEENKIEVVYQSCSDIFYTQFNKANFAIVQEKYNLPSEYVLYVGRIEKRKNLLLLIDAISKLKQDTRPPLVVVGSGKKLRVELEKKADGLKVDVIFCHEVLPEELPIFYQNATLFTYLSFFEGFGIPVLEAMASKTPLLTSSNSSMAEIVGDKAQTVNAYDVEEIAFKLDELLTKDNTVAVEKNHQRSLQFSNKKFAEDTLIVYQSLL